MLPFISAHPAAPDSWQLSAFLTLIDGKLLLISDLFVLDLVVL